MHVPLSLAVIIGTVFVLADPPEWRNAQHQTPFRGTSPPKTNKVAIIGSGIAGASVAYRLQKMFGFRIPLELVVFEKNPQIGGFINSSIVDDDTYDLYADFVDTGASYFRKDDLCIHTAIDNVGLWSKVVEIPGHRFNKYWSGKNAGVWEDYRLLFQRDRDLKARSPPDHIREVWKYGPSVLTLRKIVNEKLSLFNSLYDEGSWPNLNLSDAVRNAGLEAESTTAATTYFFNAGISPKYLQEVVEPTVRKLFGRNLLDVNALSALVALDPASVYRVDSDPNGTQELVKRLLRLSEADIRLNTRVTSIKTSSGGGFLLNTTRLDGQSATDEDETERFDVVVIASHLHNANLDLDLYTEVGLPQHFEMANTHVTHFTTPQDIHLSPKKFNVMTSDQIPNTIYTTNKAKHGIMSLEHSKVWTSTAKPREGYLENIFKIVSTHEIPDSFIAELLGYPPDTPSHELPIQWMDRQAWPDYMLNEVRGPKLDSMQLARGLFYTGVSGELLPTMEMSCRVANKIALWAYGTLFFSPNLVEGN